ncbi:hypothetical protein BDV34DRAFT_60925 [Aspergillus parasiticus]|uniref:Uncharacterized protein n=1 Tax=Aspergillus parasiticus TaxID=5067 RepID=A0A5N6DS79_ASPPA|nr:hypothetical protein BDV34DRAFT_60925 [Aspergillus parasiticus]
MVCLKCYALDLMENAKFRVDTKANGRALHEVHLWDSLTTVSHLLTGKRGTDSFSNYTSTIIG